MTSPLTSPGSAGSFSFQPSSRGSVSWSVGKPRRPSTADFVVASHHIQAAPLSPPPPATAPMATVQNSLLASSIRAALLQICPKLAEFVAEQVLICQPAHVHVCTGLPEEYDALVSVCEANGTVVRLNPLKRPNSILARTDPADVARAEKDTFICCANRCDAGPMNNWMAPTAMRVELRASFGGCMAGRTMFVVPFCMGVPGSPFSKIGVELTDRCGVGRGEAVVLTRRGHSPFVVLNMRIMTRMGAPALDALAARDATFTRCVHSVGRPIRPDMGEADARAALAPWPCNIAKRRIVHFVDGDDSEIYSFGSGYGGNSLLGKKCIALRVASQMGRTQGWLAEHMLIMGVTSPMGVKNYLLAAFPSACGKTNLAMMQSSLPGWMIEVIGDDIAWIRVGTDGRLYATNPEAGFFGVAPGTSMQSNPNAMATCASNTIFTNVALTEDGDVWWEGMTPAPPAGRIMDWQNQPWTPKLKVNGSVDDADAHVAAHKNSRFTTPITQCPVLDPMYHCADGVPIDAILFGGRRDDTMPLVLQSFNWQHGTFLGAAMRSKATAAADQSGLVSDPMAMKPFIGYNVKDYWQHWLDMQQSGTKLPPIFHVNWFRKHAVHGGFLWPGFGENVRVLEWILRRVAGAVSAQQTIAGFVPTLQDGINIRSLHSFNSSDMAGLLAVNSLEWEVELLALQRFFGTVIMTGCSKPLPVGIQYELDALAARVLN